MKSSLKTKKRTDFGSFPVHNFHCIDREMIDIEDLRNNTGAKSTNVIPVELLINYKFYINNNNVRIDNVRIPLVVVCFKDSLYV